MTSVGLLSYLTDEQPGLSPVEHLELCEAKLPY